MIKEEALKLTIEALEIQQYNTGDAKYTSAIAFIKALAEPDQEPVGYEHHEHRPFGAPNEIRIHAVLKSKFLHPDGSISSDFQWLINSYKADKDTIKLVPLYTAPPKRPWVGLTPDEINACYGRSWEDLSYEIHTAVEAKLKEKNT